MFVMASSVHVFKRTNFSQITYKASSGMEGERLHVVFGLTGICLDFTSFVDLFCFCSVLCLLCFVHVCLYVLCGHLLGKG